MERFIALVPTTKTNYPSQTYSKSKKIKSNFVRALILLLQERNERMCYASGTVDHQTYISTRSMENSKRYIVGYLTNYHDKGKEMHLSLVNGIIQMRPSFSHFDRSESRRIAEQKAEHESDMEEEEAKHVTVKFARTETERSRKAREKSFNYLLKRSDDEPWCETEWCAPDTIQAQLERQKLFSTSDESTGHALSLPSNEYVEILIPAERNFCDGDSTAPSSVYTMSKLKTFPLPEQIRQILKDGNLLAPKKYAYNIMYYSNFI